MIVIDTLLAPLRALTSIEREMRPLRKEVQALQAGVGRIGARRREPEHP